MSDANTNDDLLIKFIYIYLYCLLFACSYFLMLVFIIMTH